MKPKPLFIIVFLLGAIAFFAFLYSRVVVEKPAPPQSFPQEVKTEAINSWSVGTFPQERGPINVSIERVQEQDTIKVSWDTSSIDIFHLILFDAELFNQQSETMVVWGISSLKELSPTITKDKVPGFIPSGYVVGEIIPGFPPPFPQDISGGIQLTPGKEYFLQVNGFTKENELITVNKKFTFTVSCLAPNCQ